MIIAKSMAHNFGVLVVGFCFGLLGSGVDRLLNLGEFSAPALLAAAAALMLIGFIIRVWATAQFYEHDMQVIKLFPQGKLITTGAYAFSRNPLYVGGNFFIFLGAVLLFGSPAGLVLFILQLIGTDFFIRREERQLEREFGDEWRQYKARVRRWM